jgi:hypothetical protein
LECRGDNVGEAKQQHSTISWQTKPGQVYYILVHGSEPDHEGDFGLVVTETEPLDDGVPNDNENDASSAVEEVSYFSFVSIVTTMIVILSIFE